MFFNIYGTFIKKEEKYVEYDQITCDESMFHEMWKEVLYVGIIEEIHESKKMLCLRLKHIDGDYAEDFGDFADISYDYINQDHLNELKIDNILFYNESIGKLEFRYQEPLTAEQKIEVEKKSQKMVEFFSQFVENDK